MSPIAYRDLTGARILVTGGAGFIGSHIVDQLLEMDVEKVIVVDNMVRGRVANLADALRSRRVDLINGDIRNADLTDRLIAGADIVFHHAALRITHCAAEPEAAKEVMFDATYRIFQQCVAHDVSRVVFASSASVYGMAEVFPTSESHHPYDNRTLYGAGKTFGEGILRSFNEMYGLNYAAVRYFNVYGPRMDIHGRYTEVLVRWMERLDAGEPPLIFGDGLQTMDMIHVEDVARATILAARAPVDDEVFNVGSGEETSLLDLAGDLAAVMHRPELVPVHMPPRSVNPVARRLADVRAAKERLGFEAAISRAEGLEGLVDWWRSERDLMAKETAS